MDAPMRKKTVRLESNPVDQARPKKKRAYVVVLSGDRMGEMFPLKQDDRTTVGRGLQTDIRINDEGISRTHAVVECDVEDYYLSDAGSTNGTFANGKRVQRYQLREGDKIQIGATSVLKFTYNDEVGEDYQRTLYESALRDPVTGIFNRGYFDNRLESDVAFALRHGKPLSLVVFCVDEVATLRVHLGSDVGDRILRELAERVQSTTRSEDILARLNDDTFGLICRDVDAIRASKAAERILSTTRSKPFSVDGQLHTVTASLGVADIGMLLNPTSEALVEAADTAMSAAKRNGGHRVDIYDPEGEPTRLV